MSHAPGARRGPHRDAHHACLVYHDEEAHADAVANFLHEGLRRGERCLYVLSDHQPGALYRALRARGVDVEAAAARGQLVVRGNRESYLRHAQFVPEQMIELLAQSALDANDLGYRGLRATGEMSWALGGSTTLRTLLDYEAMADDALPKLGIRGLCQYDARLFPADALDSLVSLHPHVQDAGALVANPRYARR